MAPAPVAAAAVEASAEPSTVEASTEPSTVEAAAAEARLAVQGVPSRHAPVVETAERAPTGADLAAWRLESTPRGRVDARRPAADAASESGSTVKPAAAKPAPRASEAETPLIEGVAIHEGSAAGDEDVVVEDDSVAMPVASPAVKPPAEPAEEADVEGPERDARSGDEQPRIPIPSRPGDDGRSVHHPRVVFRYVDDLRARRFDDDRLSLLGHLRLRRRLQVARRLRAPAHVLDGAHHFRLVIDVGVAERRRPREVLVHVGEHRRKRRQRFDARVPGFLVHFLGELLAA